MVSHIPHRNPQLTLVSGGDELGELRMRLSTVDSVFCARVANGLPSSM